MYFNIEHFHELAVSQMLILHREMTKRGASGAHKSHRLSIYGKSSIFDALYTVESYEKSRLYPCNAGSAVCMQAGRIEYT